MRNLFHMLLFCTKNMYVEALRHHAVKEATLSTNDSSCWRATNLCKRAERLIYCSCYSEQHSCYETLTEGKLDNKLADSEPLGPSHFLI